MTCAKQRRREECGAVWRDGLCYKHHPEQRRADGVKNDAPRRTTLRVVFTPETQRRGVAASLAARRIER